MKYDAHLSMILGHDIFVSTTGAIYVEIKTNKSYIGKMGYSLVSLKENIRTYSEA